MPAISRLAGRVIAQKRDYRLTFTASNTPSSSTASKCTMGQQSQELRVLGGRIACQYAQCAPSSRVSKATSEIFWLVIYDTRNMQLLSVILALCWCSAPCPFKPSCAFRHVPDTTRSGIPLVVMSLAFVSKAAASAWLQQPWNGRSESSPSKHQHIHIHSNRLIPKV